MFHEYDKSLRINHILFCILTILLGTAMHFAYQWSNQNLLVGFIAPISESTWEHLKLLFYPMLFFSILEYFTIGHRFDHFIFATAIGLLVGMVMIVTIFYTYTGVIGNHFLFMDIVCFVLGVCAAYYISYSIMTEELFSSHNSHTITGLIILVFLIFCFSAFTIRVPTLPLFEPPSTHSQL